MREEFTKKDSKIAKGVAVLMLLFYHLFKDTLIVTDVEIIHILPDNIFVGMAKASRVCVAIFVFISAYGIAKGLMDNAKLSLKEAYVKAYKRAGSLLLNFFCLYVSVQLVFITRFDNGSLYGRGKQGILLMLTDSLGLANVFSTPTLNETWWYIGLALLIIFMVPLLTLCVDKIGYGLLAIAILLQYKVGMPGDLEYYWITIVVAVCAAYGDWISRIKNIKLKKYVQWPIAILGTILLLTIRQNAVVADYFPYIIDPICAFFIIVFVSNLLSKIPLVNRALEFIGNHSLNIFLVHSFFYLIVLRYFVYRFKYAIVTYLILLMMSLFYSICLELIKKGILKVIGKIKKKS